MSVSLCSILECPEKNVQYLVSTFAFERLENATLPSAERPIIQILVYHSAVDENIERNTTSVRTQIKQLRRITLHDSIKQQQHTGTHLRSPREELFVQLEVIH